MSMRFSLVICLSALALAVALPGVAYAADESNTDQAPVTLSDEQIAALEDASAEDSGDKSVFEEVGDFVTDNLAYIILGIVILAAIIAGILIMRGRSHQGGPDARSSATGQPSAAEMKRRKRAAIQRSREEERLRRKGGLEGRGSTGQAAAAAAAGAAAGTAASVDPVEAEKIGARDQQRAAAAVARTGGAIPAPASPSQTAPSAAVTAGPVAEQGPVAPEPSAQGPEPDTIVTAAPSEPQPVTPGPEPQAGQTAAALAAGAAGGALAGRATAPAAPAADPPPDQAAQDAEERLRAKVEEIKAEQAREPGGDRAPTLEQGIELQDVSFSYKDKQILEGINISIPVGSFTAIIGPSGSGKTTTLDLIIGLLQPDSGALLVDGIPLSELDMHRWRRTIGYVPQETVLLHDSVLNNVALGDTEI
ncbi:MAG: ATP-binding cassette domain-containing protein, partial [Acidobacteriota bacterium]